jgi:hypothetical protein
VQQEPDVECKGRCVAWGWERERTSEREREREKERERERGRGIDENAITGQPTTAVLLLPS